MYLINAWQVKEIKQLLETSKGVYTAQLIAGIEHVLLNSADSNKGLLFAKARNTEAIFIATIIFQYRKSLGDYVLPFHSHLLRKIAHEHPLG